MKKIILVALVLSTTGNVFASDVLNVSAQGEDHCSTAVQLYSDLVIGKDNSSVQINSFRKVKGRGDGETTSLDSQKFIINFTLRNREGLIRIKAYGPDSANRCILDRTN